MGIPSIDSTKPGCKFPLRRRRAICVRCAAEPIRMYGWDSPTETWVGPNDLGYCCNTNTRLLHQLQGAIGSSWSGSIISRTPNEGPNRFFTLIHDLADCAMALIYCDETRVGPAEIVVVVPTGRRAELREEFAFEFLGFVRFLRAISAQAELTVHEAIVSALADQRDSRALVFSVSSGLWPTDLAPALSHYVEQISLTLCDWLEECSTLPRTS